MMASSYTLITFLVLVLAGGIASIPITYKENSTSCIVHHCHKPLFPEPNLASKKVRYIVFS